MFSKLAVVATVAFAIFAAAVPTPGGSGPTCSTGTQTCCNSVQSASNPNFANVIAELLSLNVGSITGQVGLGCTSFVPVVGGEGCSEQAACCENVHSASLVGINCTPINVN